MTMALQGGEWAAAHPGCSLLPGKTRCPFLLEAGWAPGLVWMGRKSSPHQDSIPDHPAHGQSLYQLSYWAHSHLAWTIKFPNTDKYIRCYAICHYIYRPE